MIKQKTYSLLVFLLPVFSALAQDGFNDDVDDTTPLPIDNYLLVAIVVAVYIAYQYLNKKQLINKQQ